MSTKAPAYVGVRFTSSRDFQSNSTYYFKNSDKVQLSEFDTVIVDTRYGLQMAVVYNVFEAKKDLPKNGLATDFTINKSVLEKIESKVMTLMMKSERVKALKKKMQEKAKKMDEIRLFEVYAKDDPEMAAMLEQVKELSK